MPDVDRFGRLPWLWITVLVFVLDQVSNAEFGVVPLAVHRRATLRWPVTH